MITQKCTRCKERMWFTNQTVCLKCKAQLERIEKREQYQKELMAAAQMTNLYIEQRRKQKEKDDEERRLIMQNGFDRNSKYNNDFLQNSIILFGDETKKNKSCNDSSNSHDLHSCSNDSSNSHDSFSHSSHSYSSSSGSSYSSSCDSSSSSSSSSD